MSNEDSFPVILQYSNTSLPEVVRQRNIEERAAHNVRFVSIPNESFIPDKRCKSLLSLMLMLLIPNLIMILTFTVVKCQSSYAMLFRFIISNSVEVFFSSIWFFGNIDFLFGFAVIFGYMFFALLLMVLVPGNVVTGPMTPNGNVPQYKDNGFRCYILSLVSFFFLAYCLSSYTSTSVSLVYTKLPSILVCLQIFAFVFCLFLYLKGLYFPSSTDTGSSGFFFFDYYWGTELHPRLGGVDLKIFTNCRCGMTMWALMIMCYVAHSYERAHLHGGLLVNVLLQLLYITKFFWWEAGYYSTIDIMLDRAGFYICWGCLCFIPSMFTLSTYYMASVVVVMSPVYYIFVFTAGLVSLTVNYWADYQKQIFRSTKGNCLIWGNRPKLIEAFYTGQDGSLQKSLLLVSGFWGLARHFHYLPELTLAFSWCAAAGFNHLLPFSYFIFLLILLIHRVKRDDEKCSRKYGEYYLRYKEEVPWKIIPYIY